MSNFCDCGCGLETKKYRGKYNRFIVGHNNNFKKGHNMNIDRIP